MPSEPDDLTFAELRLANMLSEKVGHPIEPLSGQVGEVLACMVIHADTIAAAHGIDLGAAIRRQFSQRLPVPAQSLASILDDWES